MGPISIGLLLGLITKSAAGEAGKSAWKGLSQLARRASATRQAALDLQNAQDHDEGAQDLAQHLMSPPPPTPDLADPLRDRLQTG